MSNTKRFRDQRFRFQLYSKGIIKSIEEWNLLLESGKTDSLGFLLKEADEMVRALNVRDDKEEGSFRSYYDSYRQSLSYDTLLSIKSEHALEILQRVIPALQKQKMGDLTQYDFSMFRDFFFYYQYADVFREYWYLLPQIDFSEDFYKVYLKDEIDFLFHHYEYDEMPGSNYSLPVFNPSKEDNGATGIIPSHYFTGERASEFLKRIREKEKKLPKDVFLEGEAALFEHMLNRVIKDHSVLVLTINP